MCREDGLWNMLEAVSLIYKNYIATLGNWFEIVQEVRQKRVMSPWLFNLFIGALIRKDRKI